MRTLEDTSNGGSRRCAERWLSALKTGEPIRAPVAVVVAHPDDETLGLGGRLAGFHDLTLVHLTDGAPEDGEDARRAGFADRTAYAQARAAELEAALAALGVAPRRQTLGLKDQEAVFHLPRLAAALAQPLAGAAAVLTHAYEGGHPDHDAASFAVQLACETLAARRGRAPLRLEFAGYHLAAGARCAGRFWSEPDGPEIAAQLDEGRLARKRAALACFRSQAAVIDWFDPAQEAYRPAPAYDFTAPPPPGEALYDGFGWSLTSHHWRAQARAALRVLASGAPA